MIADDPVRLRDCEADIVIDRFDLWREGAHAIWIEGFQQKSVEDVRGKRPWTVSNSR